MKRFSLHCALLSAAIFSANSFAVGIPLMNPAEPIKISESKNYVCGADGYALQKTFSGTFAVMAFNGNKITCHDDHLWKDGKALGIIDLTGLAAESVQAN